MEDTIKTKRTHKSESGINYRQRLAERNVLNDVERIAAKHHVTVADILGRARTATIVRARKAVYMELRAVCFSYVEIAWLLGRDHTTIVAACRVAQIDTNELDTIKAERDALRREVARQREVIAKLQRLVARAEKAESETAKAA